MNVRIYIIVPTSGQNTLETQYALFKETLKYYENILN